MTRYPNALPDFTRTAWVSDAARDQWAPIVAAIGTLRQRLETDTVYRGVRMAAITEDHPANLTEWILGAAAHGCVAFPLALTADAAAYSAVQRAPRPGEPARQRIAVVQATEAARFRAAWSHGDDDTIGALLGFPGCCRAHFRRVWIADHRIDPTWQQATPTDTVDTVEVREFAPACNVLGRWMGVRQVAHLPCSFTCAATVAEAARWAAVAEAIGAGDTWRELVAMTRWPVEWSGLHGIGQIVTPVWKVIARTDATAQRLTVRVYGDTIPAEAATGLVFPYPRAMAPPEDTWTANGFASRAAMTRAHDVIAQAVKAWRPVAGNVLDLGCGSGELVRRLATGRRGGVERDPARHALAVARDPHGAYVCADLRDPAVWPAGPWDVIVCMVGRLLESDDTAADVALCDRPVVVYAYADWLAGRHIDTLIGAAGMGGRRVLARAATDAAAAVVLA